MEHLAEFINVALKLFVFGLIVRAILSWVYLVSWLQFKNSRKLEDYLDHIYRPFLAPIRKVIKPVVLNTTPPSPLDLAPWVLLLLVTQIISPFLMWLLS
jgi:uncharacterized protein YggT (Ycf19 family)